MISVITWVNKFDVYQGLVESLPDCELIPIGQEFDSMAKAYNEGTRQAHGDILLYIHQDCRIRDNRLLQALETALENPKTGFCGPIGSLVVSDRSWWETDRINLRGWLIQGEEISSFGAYDGPARQIDGYFMATKHRFTWPEEFPGIHFTDLAMCRIAEEQGFENRIFSVATQHLSQGENTSESYKQNYELYRKRFPSKEV
jgi:hypothetical protein